MNDNELGMDRTVAVSWAPDDTWPALEKELSEEDSDEHADELDAHTAEAPPPAPLTGTPAGGQVMDAGFPIRSLEGSMEPPPAVEAVAAIEGHPLHPAIVPLPIGAFVGAFACDLLYARTHDRFWARSARMLTGAGLATGALAGALGALDFTGRREIRSHRSAWVHAGGNLAVLGLGAVSELLRARDERRAVGRGALAISAASVALLGLTGWLGGELAFRERIGVTES